MCPAKVRHSLAALALGLALAGCGGGGGGAPVTSPPVMPPEETPSPTPVMPPEETPSPTPVMPPEETPSPTPVMPPEETPSPPALSSPPRVPFELPARIAPGDPPSPTVSYSGDKKTAIMPSQSTRTHVLYDDGVLAPSGNAGISITAPDNSQSQSVRIGKNAEIRITDGNAVNLLGRRTQSGLVQPGDYDNGNRGDVEIVNRGTVKLTGNSNGLRALSRGTGNARVINYGTIELTVPEENSSPNLSNRTLLLASVNKSTTPRDFTNFRSHQAEVINMPTGKLIATQNRDRVNGLKIETGSGHLSRVVNYGTIEIAGDNSRGLSAQTLWGQSEALNFGSVTMSGQFAIGVRAGTCAPWVVPGGCHQNPHEHVPNRNTNAPGYAYARNFEQGVIVTKMTDSRHRNLYGLLANPLHAGRAYAINDGSITTAGKWSHGVLARGYTDLRDNAHLAPDTTGHDFAYAENSGTGTVSTAGEEAHGVMAAHYRGGSAMISNRGRVTVTGMGAAGLLALSTGGKILVNEGSGEDICSKTFDGGRITDRNTQCQRSYDGGEVTVVNRGNVAASGRNGVGISAKSLACDRLGSRPTTRDACTGSSTASGGDVAVFNSGSIRATGTSGIGIDAESHGGDIAITSTGSIVATQIGVRARTAEGKGTIRIRITGTLNAPTPVEIHGGTDNDIVRPSVAGLRSSLDRATVAFAAPFIRTEPAAGAPLSMSFAGDGALRLDFRDAGRFGYLDLLAGQRSPSGVKDVRGLRFALGTTLETGEVALTPTLLLGFGDARASAAYVESQRRFEQYGLALRLGDGAETFLGLDWRETRFRTDTHVRAPGLVLEIDEPDAVARRLRVDAGVALTHGARLRMHWSAVWMPGHEPSRNLGAILTFPLPLR